MGDAPRPPLNKMGEERCTVTQSLCGCDLKQGSLAIGIVYLILGIIGLIGGIDGSAKGAGMSLVQLIVQLLQCIICVLLILGVRKDNRRFIMIWVYVSIVTVVFSILGAILSIITVVVLLASLLQIYCIVVVRSYALTLSEAPAAA